jgi:hypothetical protein
MMPAIQGQIVLPLLSEMLEFVRFAGVTGPWLRTFTN